MRLGVWGLVLLGGVVGLTTTGCSGWAWRRTSDIKTLEDTIAQLRRENKGLKDDLSSGGSLSQDLRKERDAALRDNEKLSRDLTERDKTIATQRDMLTRFQDLANKTADAQREAERLAREREKQLADLLADLRLKWTGDGVTIKEHPYGTAVVLAGDLAFAPGKAELRDEVKKALDAIAQQLRQLPGEIRVAGHSDSQPIKHTAALWDSNLHLSGARALAVLNYLAAHGVDEARMHFAGYGRHELIMKGGEEDQAASRRVEIILLTLPGAQEQIDLRNMGKVLPGERVVPRGGPPAK